MPLAFVKNNPNCHEIHVDLCEFNSIIMEMFVKFFIFFIIQHNKMNSISAFDGSAFLTNN